MLWRRLFVEGQPRVTRYTLPPLPTVKLTLTWLPDFAAFSCVDDAGCTIAAAEYTLGVPTPGGQRIHLNLW